MADLLKKAMEVGFDKRQKPSMLLSNMFKTKLLRTTKVEVQGRVVKSIYSVDVKLGTGGRRVELSSYDKKEFTIPEYNNFDIISEEDIFKVQLGETEYNQQIANIANLINDKQIPISDMQKRAVEKQASDALFQGKIVLTGGTEIKFNKKATHTISKSTAKWNGTSGDPIKDIGDACKLCIEDGLLTTTVFNFFAGDDVLNALLKNENFRENADANKGIKRSDIGIPEEQVPGGVYHGRISVGSSLVNIWTYNEKYTIPTGYDFAGEGTTVSYIPAGCALLVPVNPNFTKYYAAINNVNAPSGIGGSKLQLVETEQLPYAYDELVDGSAITKAGVKSRPLCVPVDVDCFATFKDLV